MSDDEDQPRRSRRARNGRTNKAQDALEELKRLRKHGKAHRQDVESLVPDLYDEVDEEEYAEKFGKDDFVVDDDGNGYVDNGQDDDDSDMFYEKDAKEKKKKDRREGRVKKGALDNYFSAVIPKNKKTEAIEAKKIDEDLNKMLTDIANNLDEDIAPIPKRRKLEDEFSAVTPVNKKAEAIEAKKIDEDLDKMLTDIANNLNEEIAPVPESKKLKDELFAVVRENKKTEAVEKKKIDENMDKMLTDIDYDLDEDIAPVPESKELEDEFSAVNLENEKSTRVLRFYYIDAYEDSKHPGKVFLFGFTKKDENFESCCVIMEKIGHRVYFVGRDKHLDTQDPVTPLMMYNEVNDFLLKQFQIPTFKSKAVSKRFAYMDGLTPEEATCLEVCYDSHYKTLPPGPCNGKTFSRIANATVTALERLLIERNIKGPCLLEIRDIDEVQNGFVSTCQREFKAVVSKVELDIVNVIPNVTSHSLPPCKMMALNIITVANRKTSKAEIVLITVLLSNTYFLDRRTPTRWQRKISFICPPSGTILPVQFKQDADKNKLEVETFANEKSLLQKFLIFVKAFDPDVVIGHDLASQMAILRNRIEDDNVNTWGFMGRLRRKENLKQCPQNKQFRWTWTAGRLYLDSKSAAAELVHSQSYDLDELVSKVLVPVDPAARRINVDSDFISNVFYENGGRTDLFFKLIQWSSLEAQFAHRILAELNAMQLFLQITQIVGGILSRTLMGGRAERNEYLLLHAFFREGYISPDKYAPKVKGKQSQALTTNGSKEDGPPAKKKAQYIGGRVFDPEKGLYQTYVVLLDFNSLYPSIIQEFKICFTTVKPEPGKEYDNPEDVPPYPDKNGDFGILPIEIGQLVQNRRNVKNEMKKITDKNSQVYKQMDIRQLGLKLTANSMYGCLGFDGSRFCAQVLAKMITLKGREILERTKAAVEAKSYAVVYGDTDSIMVNTNTCDLEEALRIGREIKKSINQSYAKLELDIDGVYKRLLLLKKKKYAGLSIDITNPQKTSKELKGLDIVRRDWSGLVRDVGYKVIDIILESADRDEMVEGIRKTLNDVKEALEGNTVPIEKYEILKSLTHRPEDYRDAKAQPHVQVALRLNQTRNANLRQKDIVKYIICDDGTGSPFTQRAYARIEVETSQNLKIDTHYYLAHQIHPVVSRLVEPFEELDECQVALALGLDGSSYRQKVMERAAENEDENTPPGISYDFQLCKPLPITCRCCSTLNLLTSPINEFGKPALYECSNPSCSQPFYDKIANVEDQIVKFLWSTFQKFSQRKYICNYCHVEVPIEPLHKDGSEYPCHACYNGVLHANFTLKRLYDQQVFVMKIVNFADWMAKEATKDQRDTLQAYEKVLPFMDSSKSLVKLVQKSINENPYNRVDLSKLFAPMKP